MYVGATWRRKRREREQSMDERSKKRREQDDATRKLVSPSTYVSAIRSSIFYGDRCTVAATKGTKKTGGSARWKMKFSATKRGACLEYATRGELDRNFPGTRPRETTGHFAWDGRRQPVLLLNFSWLSEGSRRTISMPAASVFMERADGSVETRRDSPLVRRKIKYPIGRD